MAQAELKIVRLLPGPALYPACPPHPRPPLMDTLLQALHEVYTMQRQPWHQAPHPRAVPDSTAAEGSLHPASEGPAQGHTGPAPGPVSGSQGKPWEHQLATVSAEPGAWAIPWEGGGMGLTAIYLSSPLGKVSLGPICRGSSP